MKINIYDPAKSAEIEYTFLETPFGRCIAAYCNDGICDVCFADGSIQDAIDGLQKRWADTTIHKADIPPIGKSVPKETNSAHSSYFGWLPHDALCLKGTPLQLKVWEALTAIPYGTTLTYSEVAALIGRPDAVRAVATAIAANRIALLIPCHRVIRRDGSLSGYRWGQGRKNEILVWEKENDQRHSPDSRDTQTSGAIIKDSSTI